VTERTERPENRTTESTEIAENNFYFSAFSVISVVNYQASLSSEDMADTIGDFEQLILFALVRLGADAYGVTVRREIEGRTGRAISPGALYTALDRLERRGLVSSRLGEPTPERGGKRKRLYTLQPAGERALARVYESLRLMASGVATRLRTSKS
jgi:PadR family transcriptional regulator